ncbi:unnamed protein product [Sphenostylis stenocarpa]|uniref:Secreted protein n=1 Tax=Sphenostylis stenocarpa TaxID=92480 RepID=A0AA86RND5_9FABA|nr:unnamed protein product [Sphenostylis stenocarpa]
MFYLLLLTNATSTTARPTKPLPNPFRETLAIINPNLNHWCTILVPPPQATVPLTPLHSIRDHPNPI